MTEEKSVKQRSIEKIEKAYGEILDALFEPHGLDWKVDPNFIDTPKRIARSLINERCCGIKSIDKCKDYLKIKFPSNYNGMVVTNPLTITSLCPHHFENVTYQVIIGYIAKGSVVGLSKIGRVATMLAKQPILQEEYTMQMADIFTKELNSEGLGVIVKGQHMCMVARGLQQPDVWVVTSELRGSFLIHPLVKDEFLKICKI